MRDETSTEAGRFDFGLLHSTSSLRSGVNPCQWTSTGDLRAVKQGPRADQDLPAPTAYEATEPNRPTLPHLCREQKGATTV